MHCDNGCVRTSAKRHVVFRWVLNLTCVGLCAYWIAGFWLFARVSDNLNFTLWFWRGRIELWLFDSGTAPSITVHCWAVPEPAELHGLSARLWRRVWLDIAQVPERDVIDTLGGWPQFYRPDNEFLCVSVPVWLLLAVATVGLVRTRMLRRKANARCVCGYDLTGNVSGRCPECGTLTRCSDAPVAG